MTAPAPARPVALTRPSDPVEVTVDPHGARLTHLRTPDRHGVVDDVVLTTPDPRSDRDFLGATVGRYANRIAGGRFVLDGVEHVLTRNEPGATLHGGDAGLDHADFVPDPVVDTHGGGRALTLRHVSPAGDGGFPGRLAVTVTYTVTGHDLGIDFTATTDAPTVVNLTNHAYLTLGAPAGVGDLRITVFGSRYLPVDEALVPAGRPARVAGGPFDLRRPTPIGRHLRDDHPQLRVARGYDHTWVLDGSGPAAPAGLRAAAHLADPDSGRTLTVFTDRPGLQFYSGNLLDGTARDAAGRAMRQGDAVCLEPQDFPDAPNRPDFPDTVLRPGETYRHRMVLRAGVAAAA